MFKKLIYSVFVLASIFSVSNVSAQDKVAKTYSKVQVSASVGTGSLAEFGETFGDAFRTNCRGYEAKTDYTPTLNVQGTCSLTKRLSVGVTVSGQKGTLTTENHGVERERYHVSVLPTIRLNWINRQHFGLYSGAAFGVKWRFDDYADNTYDVDEWSHRFAFQLTGVGVEGGFKHVHAFAEVGVGEQGFLQGGIRARF